MNDVVKVSVFEAFVSEHAGREAVLEARDPDQSMKARLRPYFPMPSDTGSIMFSVECDSKVVALSECVREPGANRYGLCYVSVDRAYRDQGLASTVVQAITDDMKQHGCATLVSSYYTASGESYLKDVLRRLVKQGITLYEGNRLYRGHPRASKRP